MVQRQTKYGIATNNTLKKNAYINQQLKASGDIFIYLKNDDNYNNETVTVRNYSLDKQKRWELVEELQKQQQEEEEEQDNNKPQLLTKKERKEKNQVNKKLNFEKSLTKSKYQNKLITEEEKKKKLAQQQLEQLEEEENNNDNYDEKYYEEEQQPKIKVLNAEKNYRQNPMIFRIDKDEKEDGQIEVFERPTRSELFKMNQQNKSRYDHKPVENRKSKKENFTNSLNL